MEVGVTALRSHLKNWLDRAAQGEEIIITDHGVPVARLIGIDAKPILEQLEEQGVIRLPRRHRRTVVTERDQVTAAGSVSEFITEQRGR